jgi:hypothetical protein
MPTATRARIARNHPPTQAPTHPQLSSQNVCVQTHSPRRLHQSSSGQQHFHCRCFLDGTQGHRHGCDQTARVTRRGLGDSPTMTRRKASVSVGTAVGRKGVLLYCSTLWGVPLQCDRQSCSARQATSMTLYSGSALTRPPHRHSAHRLHLLQVSAPSTIAHVHTPSSTSYTATPIHSFCSQSIESARIPR